MGSLSFSTRHGRLGKEGFTPFPYSAEAWKKIEAPLISWVLCFVGPVEYSFYTLQSDICAV